MGTIHIIDLSSPIGSERVRYGFQPHWRTLFRYKCSAGHIVRVFANSYIGKNAVPGVGGITCPQCEFQANYAAGIKKEYKND